MTGHELDEIIRELYVLPPADFVAARNELVRQARAAGSRQVAERLQGLRRPSRSAWMVNLLARDREAMLRLSTLGRELREAQNELAHTELRSLSERRRRLIADLLDRAQAYAGEVGLRLTATVLSEIEATLQAALVDLAGALTVRNGRLVRPLTHTGFGPRARARVLQERLAAPSPTAAVVAEPSAPEDVDPPREDELARRRTLGGLRVVRLLEDPGPPSPADDAEPEAEPGVRRAADELAAAEAAHWQAEFELADAEGAVEAADDRVTSLDTARIEARRDKVTAQRYLAEARSRQREAVTALAEARRRLEEAHNS